MNSSGRPLVSVVVPARNEGPALRRLLDALAAQTLPRESFEVVIGDDGSTDGSTAGLATSEGWVRVATGPPVNSYSARNRAARLARAPALAFCDADCTPEATWLEAGLAALAERPLAGGHVRFGVPEHPTLWTLLTLDLFLDQEAELGRSLGLTANLFVSRELFERLGGFDDSLPSGGDGDLVSRGVASGVEPRFAPAAVVWHPTHDGARALLRRIWFQSRWRSVRLARAGVRPYGLRLRWWVPVVSKVRERRRTGRSLLLDRRRLASAGVVPRRRDHAKALPIIYLVIPYLAATAQVWGWFRSRRSPAGVSVPWSPRVVIFPRRIDNPYLALLAHELGARGLEVSWGSRFDLRWLWRQRRRVDVIHFHWPELYYLSGRSSRRIASALSWITLGLFAVRLVAARALGYRIVWTIHQVYPHEAGRTLLHRVAGTLLARASNALFVHDRATSERAERDLGRCVGRKTTVIPHGSYIDAYPPGRPREVVRKELGIPVDALVFLSFGSIRKYKEHRLLLEAFDSLRRDDAVLLVVGKPRDATAAAKIRAAAREDPRIKPVLRFVPEERVAELLVASDVAVLTRNDGGTSGVLVLALSMGLPVIAARKPAYEELLREEVAGWLYQDHDPDALCACLDRVARAPTALGTKGTAARAIAEGLSWQEAGARTAAAIAALGTRRRRQERRTTTAEISQEAA
jgi:beta-1,4-mannosyltransferase